MIINVHQGDCRGVLASFDENSIDAGVTDPPYHLTSIVKRFGAGNAAPAKVRKTGAYARASKGFMGQTWDGGDVAFDPETWRAIYRVLKPGAHLIAFSGTRTYHRMVCAIEDAGFEIRDQLAWLYGSGFPKSHNVSKGIDRAAGASADREIIRERYTAKRIKPGATVVADGNYGKQDIAFTATDTVGATEEAREWDGWGSALKPALEPIVLARKPLSEKSIAANVLRWGVGALNIDGCRVETADGDAPLKWETPRGGIWQTDSTAQASAMVNPKGRWPTNVLHDGSREATEQFPDTASGGYPPEGGQRSHGTTYGQPNARGPQAFTASEGSAARFFYSAKAGPLDRMGSEHPTVKPVDLMRWLCRLVTPPGGTILDPFAGSGTTGIAAMAEGFNAELIDLEAKHVADIERKLALLRGEGRSRFAEQDERKAARPNIPEMPLFAGEAA